MSTPTRRTLSFERGGKTRPNEERDAVPVKRSNSFEKGLKKLKDMSAGMGDLTKTLLTGGAQVDGCGGRAKGRGGDSPHPPPGASLAMATGSVEQPVAAGDELAKVKAEASAARAAAAKAEEEAAANEAIIEELRMRLEGLSAREGAAVRMCKRHQADAEALRARCSEFEKLLATHGLTPLAPLRSPPATPSSSCRGAPPAVTAAAGEEALAAAADAFFFPKWPDAAPERGESLQKVVLTHRAVRRAAAKLKAASKRGRGISPLRQYTHVSGRLPSQPAALAAPPPRRGPASDPLERARAAKAAALARAEALTATGAAAEEPKSITCCAYTNRGGDGASTKENQDAYFTHAIDGANLIFGVRDRAVTAMQERCSSGVVAV